MAEIDGKSCFSLKKMISTSEWRAEHPLAGQNTQQLIKLWTTPTPHGKWEDKSESSYCH